MFLFHASTSLSCLLLLAHVTALLLVKHFRRLLGHIAVKEDRDDGFVTVPEDDIERENRHGSEYLPFWFGESESFLVGSSLVEEDPFATEPSQSPTAQDRTDVKQTADELIEQQTYSVLPDTISRLADNREANEAEGRVKFNKNVEWFARTRFEDAAEFVLEDGYHEESEKNGGSLSLQSMSKSSAEWRSSTVTRESETDYPFSSSSRRSSSKWDTYALFRKYDEEMLYFSRISAQKLSETESFRSLKYQPRSISQRIFHKLISAKQARVLGESNPFRDLENAYVAQICLTWEALNWDYSNYRRLSCRKSAGALFCPARVAQEVHQFQVLLQRFIENEPYECGRRPEIFAKFKISSPNLLLVPEFREVEEETEEAVSLAEFLFLIEDAIKTFMDFLKGDKQNHCEKLKSLMKKSSSVDRVQVKSLKKSIKKKERRLQDFLRRKKCLRRRWQRKEDEMNILMALIDMKVTSRVLRTRQMTAEQLRWCEEKMSKIKIFDGQMQRDSSPLPFPLY